MNKQADRWHVKWIDFNWKAVLGDAVLNRSQMHLTFTFNISWRFFFPPYVLLFRKNPYSPVFGWLNSCKLLLRIGINKFCCRTFCCWFFVSCTVRWRSADWMANNCYSDKRIEWTIMDSGWQLSHAWQHERLIQVNSQIKNVLMNSFHVRDNSV